MKIAIISDTHNNTNNLQKALAIIHRENIDTLIHCGDLTDLEMLSWFGGLRVNYVFGNGDYLTGAIRQELLRQNPASTAGMVFEGLIDGFRIAAAHGHTFGTVENLAASQGFDYLFCGHTHHRRDEWLGKTRIINPGSLGGVSRSGPSFCLLDCSASDLQFILLE